MRATSRSKHSTAAFSLFALVMATAIALPAHAQDNGWIATWGAAPSTPFPADGPFPPTPGFENQTIRQIVQVSVGGDQVAVRLTNEYGTAPLEIGAARIGLAGADGAIVPGSERVLTFSGLESATIPPGAPLVSDPVDLAVDDRAQLSVSIYFPGDTGPCTCHPLGLQTAYVSEPGDHTGEAFEPAETVTVRAFLSGVMVTPAQPGRTIVALGDSITDGEGSTLGANRRWPDYLSRRLLARDDDAAWGVVNMGISGNRLLAPGAGDAALTRFDRDVLSVPGLAYIVLFEGVNDISFSLGRLVLPDGFELPPQPKITAADMIAGYRQIIARAHARGVKVYGATISPFKGVPTWTEEGEAVRLEVNEWIRTGGAFDAVLDFDAVLRDPADPSVMREGLHSGDFIHGSDAGYEAMAESIDLNLFR